MDDRLAEILDQCLERLTQGATIEECLAAFPSERAELELPLRMAGRLRALPHPPLPAATRVSLEQIMLDSAKRRRMNRTPSQPEAAPPARRHPWGALAPAAVLASTLRALGYRGPLLQPRLRLAALVVTIVLALALSAGTYAAARALISIAQPQPTAAPSIMPTATATTTPTATPIALDGPIEQFAQERWVVGGRAVILTASTTISGTPALNAIAHVQGELAPNGALLAERISIDSAATPTATPTATAPPTPTVTPSPTITPSLTLAPTATPTAIPPAPQPAAPQPAAPPAATQPPAAPPGDDQQHTCQGQQRGRDDKKCDPKPKKPDQKPDKDKPDKKDKKGG